MSINNTVLVISDRWEQYALTTALLREAGYLIRFAGTVRDAVEMTQAECPHLIISELAMPDIDGLDLCRQIRRSAKTSNVPIVLLGDLSNENPIVADGRRCGANDYVQKPIANGELFDRCYRIIASHTRDPFSIRSEPVDFVKRVSRGPELMAA